MKPEICMKMFEQKRRLSKTAQKRRCSHYFEGEVLKPVGYGIRDDSLKDQ
jgi:hypothetical protein